MNEEFEGRKCDECHQNKQETVGLNLPDGTHTVVCRECVEAIVEQFQAEEVIIPQPEQEPVAWMYDWTNEIGELIKGVYVGSHKASHLYELENLQPLYTIGGGNE